VRSTPPARGHQQRQLVLRTAERAMQWRQLRLIIGKLAARVEHIDTVGAARIEGVLHQLQIFLIVLAAAPPRLSICARADAAASACSATLPLTESAAASTSRC